MSHVESTLTVNGSRIYSLKLVDTNKEKVAILPFTSTYILFRHLTYFIRSLNRILTSPSNLFGWNLDPLLPKNAGVIYAALLYNSDYLLTKKNLKFGANPNVEFSFNFKLAGLISLQLPKFLQYYLN